MADLMLAGLVGTAAVVALADPRRLLVAAAALGAVLVALGLLLGLVGL